MDHQSLLRSLQLLVQAFPALPHTVTRPGAPDAAAGRGSAPSFSHIRRLLTLPSITDDECRQLQLYLAHLLTLPHQQTLRTASSPCSPPPLDLTVAPLPAFPLTTHLIRLFRPLLAALVSAAVASPAANAELAGFQRTAVVMSHVVTLCPHLQPAVVSFLSSSSFSLFDSIPTPTPAAPAAASEPVLHLVYAAYRFLAADFRSFQPLFRWSALHPLLVSSNGLTRHYAAHCLAAALRLNDQQKETMLLQFTHCGVDDEGQDAETVERRQSEALQAEIGALWVGAMDSPATPPTALATATPAAASALTSSPSPASSSSFVTLPSTASLLHSLSLLLTQRRPVLLSGDAGCGKTALVHHLHSLLSSSASPLLTLHVADGVDSKTLLGAYTCTDRPGEFRFQPGALTTAMTEGRWVLLEDADRAGWDVASGLRSLMERGEVEVRGEMIRARDGFRLFATTSGGDGSVGSGRGGGGARAGRGGGWEMLRPFFSSISLPPLSEDDLSRIITALYPAIPLQYLPCVLSTYALFTSASSSALFPLLQQSLGSRRLTSRDLLRWCRRLAWLFGKQAGWNTTGMGDEMMDSVMRSIIEVFLSSIPQTTASASSSSASLRHQLMAQIVSLWSFPPERVDHHLQRYRPRYELTDSALSIASYTFPIPPRAPSLPSVSSASRPFTATRHSLQLLSQLASCLHHNDPLLLVGQTGTGKCFAAGTQLRLMSGETVKVEQLMGGEQLMGDDGTPRVVTAGSLARGRAPLFRVNPAWGGACNFTVNGDHILVLCCTMRPHPQRAEDGCDVVWYEVDAGTNRLQKRSRRWPTAAAAEADVAQRLQSWQPVEWEVSVDAFLQAAPHIRNHCQLLASGPVSFIAPHHPSLQRVLERLLNAPASEAQLCWAGWYLGLWLMVGLPQSESVGLGGPHHVRRLREYSALFGESCAEGRDPTTGIACVQLTGRAGAASIARRLLQSYPQVENRIVPMSWLCDSLLARRCLLAGMLDGDGWYEEQDNAFDVCSRYEAVISGCKIIAASLGIRQSEIDHVQAGNADTGDAHARFRVSLSGHMDEVLQRCVAVGRQSAPGDSVDRELQLLNSRCFYFTITQMQVGDYYGFAVTGPNRRFLLPDFTVTHNTSLLSYLASSLHRPLTVLNLSNQTDAADLLGGYRPYDVQQAVLPLVRELVADGGLFGKVLSRTGNVDWLGRLEREVQRKEWTRVVRLMEGVAHTAAAKLGLEGAARQPQHGAGGESGKRLLLVDDEVRQQWQRFYETVTRLSRQLSAASKSSSSSSASSPAVPLFHFHEGALVTALRTGGWILLDEMNLASAETLERLTSVLDSSSGSLSLTERGDVEAVPRHPAFRLFAAMNPPDYGKKELPPSIRQRMVELWVSDVDDADDLLLITHSYLQRAVRDAGRQTVGMEAMVSQYLELRSMTSLLDGSGQQPLYSLRTYCRALSFAASHAAQLSFPRAVYEGFMLAFASPLSVASKQRLSSELLRLCSLRPAAVSSPPSSCPPPHHVHIAGFHVPLGPAAVVDDSASFISTATIALRLRDLARALLSPLPVLLQGPTSAGKTSLVSHLARRTGHALVRINNHQHTDVAEYLGSYVTGDRGQLQWREGALVQAVRQGWWLLLDELNLAPSEVLEALNRLLDDNRELFLPETQQTVTAHPAFRLFATQNPPGLYGGRKQLSRAFLNRFVVFHIDDLPASELSDVISRRCLVPASHAARMVAVMEALQQQRDAQSLFLGKTSLITPRDLFRWGERMRGAKDSTLQTLADTGFMLLGERLRNEDGRQIVRKVIEEACGKGKEKGKTGGGSVQVDTERLYSMTAVQAMVRQLTGGRSWEEVLVEEAETAASQGLGRVAWTRSMRRMFILAAQCVLHKEPVLLVGGTALGKTTVCQLFSLLLRRPLESVNCHQHTETADFLGSLRPIRNREAIAQQLQAEIAHWANRLDNSVLPPSLQGLVDDTDRTELCSGDATRAMTAAHRVVTAIEQRMAERHSAGEETRKRQAAHQQGRESNKRKKHRAQSQPPPAMEENIATAAAAHEAAVLSPADSAQLAALLSSAQSLLSLHARSQSLFEWRDGPLVSAMRCSHLLLIDELSLADDAVLERLNPALEPERSILLSEKGDNGDAVLVAGEGFAVFATMNPGGDFGKKELSPALRNRLTEVWVDGWGDAAELQQIVGERLGERRGRATAGSEEAAAWEEEEAEWSGRLVEFVLWYNAGQVRKRQLSLRDVLGWARFMAHLTQPTAPVLSMEAAFLHGAALTLLDGIGIGSSDSSQQVNELKLRCVQRLLQHTRPERRRNYLSFLLSHQQLPALLPSPSQESPQLPIVSTETEFGVPPFLIARGPLPVCPPRYSFSSPTPHLNLQRLLRALHLPRAILLEGSPGVGKTSLVSALAAAAGHPLVRINLSEQTDMMDLLGSDLPAPAPAPAGSFTFCDGAFLQALKRGHWLLLDELNLASQSVLEGLNSVLDHRAAVFIPELGQTFRPPASFRLFACQNPAAEGGGRRGLPASFLNRFTKVELAVLAEADLLAIGSALWPSIPQPSLQRIIRFNQTLYDDVVTRAHFARLGGPWEFNLRDVGRWCQLITQRRKRLPDAVSGQPETAAVEEQQLAVHPGDDVDLLYLQRMRTREDRAEIVKRYYAVFGRDADTELRIARFPEVCVTASSIRIGAACLARVVDAPLPALSAFPLLRSQSAVLSHLITCVNAAYPVLLVGSSCTGKSSLVETLAALSGHRLLSVQINAALDSSDLLGGFEQLDLTRETQHILRHVADCTLTVCAALLGSPKAGRLAEKAVSTVQGRQVESVGKRRRADSAGRGQKKRRGAAAADKLDGHSSSESRSSLPSIPQLFTASALHRQLEQLQLACQTVRGDASSSIAAFTQPQQELLSGLLSQLASAVSSHSIALPPHLSPQSLSSRLSRLSELSSSPSAVIGSFQWLDGSLLTALEQGHWLLLDNVNYCSAAVLDRLNALLESGGALAVTECGLIDGRLRVVVPHPEFRLFASMDEQYGQVSRAMRNRCCEIAIIDRLGEQTTDEQQAQQAVVSGSEEQQELTVPAAEVEPVMSDLLTVCNALGVPGVVLPTFLVSAHRRVLQAASASSLRFQSLTAGAVTIRQLEHWCRLLSQQVHSGSSSLFDALRLTFSLSYPVLNHAADLKLQAAFTAAYEQLVVQRSLYSALLAPGVWPSPPSLPSPLASASAWSVHRSASLLSFLTRLSACHDVVQRPQQAGTEQLLSFVQAHPSFRSCLPDSALTALTGTALPSRAAASTADAAADIASSAPLIAAVTYADLTRDVSALSVSERRALVQSSALVPAYLVSSHPLHPLPSPLHLLRLSLLHFLAAASTDDLPMRLQQLRYLASLSPVAAPELNRGALVLQRLHSSEVLQRCLQDRQQLATRYEVSSAYVNSRPWSSRLLPERRDAAVSILPLYLSCLHRQALEQEAYSAVQDRAATASLSLIQQSFAHHHGLLGGRLLHDVVAPLFPLFLHLDAVVLSCVLHLASVSSEGHLSSSSLLPLQSVCEQRDLYWDCLHAPLQRDAADGRQLVDVEAIQIRWHRLTKAVTALRDGLLAACALLPHGVSSVFQSLFSHLDSLRSVLGLQSTTGSKAYLFKRGGHPLLPRSLQLSDLQRALLELSRLTRWDAADNAAFWHADQRWRSLLLEALCDIRYVSYQSYQSSAASPPSLDTDSLIASLLPLPSALSARLDALKAEAQQRQDREAFSVQLLSDPESSLEDLGLSDLQLEQDEQQQAGQAADSGREQMLQLRTGLSEARQGRAVLSSLLPLADVFAVGGQQEAVSLMAAFVSLLAFAGDGANQRLQLIAGRLLSQLPALISFSSRHSTAETAALAPFQSSQWIVQRLNTALGLVRHTGRDGAAAADVARLLAVLPSVLSELTFAHFSFLHTASFMRTDAAGSLGSAVLQTPLLSSFLTSLITRASAVSLVDRQSKRAQIAAAVELIVGEHDRKRAVAVPGHDSSSRGKESQQAERLLAVSQLVQTVCCYEKAFELSDFALLSSVCDSVLAAALGFCPPPELSDSTAAVLTAALERCRDARFHSLLHSHIVPAIQVACIPPAGISDSQLSRLSLLVSLLRLLLYLPLSPYDTSRSHLLALSDSHLLYSALLHRVQYRQHFDSLTTGASRPLSPQSQHDRRDKQEKERRMRRVREKVVVRRQGGRARYGDLYDELWRFAVEFDRKVRELEERLTSRLLRRGHQEEEEGQLLLRAVVHEGDVAMQFVSHLQLLHGDYSDVTEPIIAAVLQAKAAMDTALRIATRDADDAAAISITQTLTTLLSFPLPSSSSVAASSDMTPLQSLASLLHPAALTTVDSVCQRAVAALQHRRQQQQPQPGKMRDGGDDRAKTEEAQLASASFATGRVQILLSVLSRAVLLYRQQRTFASSSASSSLYSLFEVLFSSFVDCWQREREERRKQEEAAQQLYRYEEREVSALTEEEEDDKMRRQLYPDYRDDWKDLEQQRGHAAMDDEEQEAEAKAEARRQAEEQRQREEGGASMHLSAEHQQVIHSAFLSLFSSSPSSSAQQPPVAEQHMVDAYAAGYTAASTLLSALSLCPSPALSSLPSALDDDSLVGHLFMLADSHHRLHTLAAADTDAWLERERTRKAGAAGEQDGGAEPVSLSGRELRRRQRREQRRAEVAAMPDVWRQANVEELRRLEPALLSLSVRVRAILNEYPRQELLLQLLRIVHRLSSLPSSSPVMQLLSGTELLLRKTEDWERFASRQVSLQREARQLRALVVRWRKMELYSWPRALRAVEDRYRLTGLTAFFHLWSVLHVEPDWQPGAEEERRFFLSLHDSLLGFLRSQCKLGELETRLDVVLTFAHEMDVAADINAASSSSASQAQRRFRLRLRNLLLNAHHFYRQSLPLVSAFVSQVSAPLEQQLTEQVQLARWDLNNYEQLRESSDKNHRRLVSVARRYDEMLAMNVSSLLDREEERRDRDKQVNLGRPARELEKLRRQRQVQQADADRRRQRLLSLGVETETPDTESSLSSALFAAPPDASLYVVETSELAASLSAIVVPSSSSSKPRTLLSIMRKMRRLLLSSLLHSGYADARRQAGAAVEGLTADVIDRIHSLQASDANKHRKRTALVDVRKALEAIGLRHSEEDINREKRAVQPEDRLPIAGGGGSMKQEMAEELVAIPVLFHSQPLSDVFAVSSSTGYTASASYAALQQAAAQCDEYGWKVSALLLKMKVKVTSHHADLSAAEVRRGKGMLDFLSVCIANLRSAIARLGRLTHSIAHWTDNIQPVAVATAAQATSPAAPAASSFSCPARLWHHKEQLDSLLTSLQHYSCLCHRVAGILTASPVGQRLVDGGLVLTAMVEAVQSMKGAVDAEIERIHPSSAAFDGSALSDEVMQLSSARLDSFMAEQRQRLRAEVSSSTLLSLPFVPQAMLALLQSLTAEGTGETTLATADSGAVMEEEQRLTAAADASHLELIRRVQLLVQDVTQIAEPQRAEQEDGSAAAPLSLTDELRHLARALLLQRFQDLQLALSLHIQNVALLSTRSASTAPSAIVALSSLHPLLLQTVLMAERALSSSLAFLRSVTKLSFVLLSAFTTLLTHGFCGKEKEEKEEDSGKTEEGVEGTGMGEGQGEKDVSDQLKEEHQLEGLREEKEAAGAEEEKAAEQQQERSREELEKGMEMQQEFDGELLDMPQEEKDDQQRDDEGEEEEEGEQLDREMGEGDDKQDVVDEKVWDESDEEEGSRDRTKERQEQGGGIHGHQDDMEMVANDEQQEEDDAEDGNTEEEKRRESEDEDEGRQPQQKPDGDAEVDEEEEAGGVNAADDDREEEAHNIEPFELPEDVKLDDAEDGSAPTAEGQEDDEGAEEGEDEDVEELTEQERQRLEGESKEEPEEQAKDEQSEQKLEEEHQAELPVEQSVPDKDERIEPAESAEQDRTMEEQTPDEQPEGEGDEQQPPVQAAVDDKQALGQEQESGGDTAGQGERADETRHEREEEKRAEDETQRRQPPQPVEEHNAARSAANAQDAETGEASEWRASDTRQQQSQDRQQQQQRRQQRRRRQPQVNPYESIGDAAKRWQERLKVLHRDDEAEDEEEMPELRDEGEEELRGAVENVRKEERADAQLLGPVEEKEEQLQFPKEERKEEKTEEEESSMMEEEERPHEDDDGDMKDDDEQREQQGKRKRGGRDRLAPTRFNELSAAQSAQDERKEEEQEPLDLLSPHKAEEAAEEEEESKQSSIGPMLLDAGLPLSSSALTDDAAASDELMRRLRAELDERLPSASSSAASSALIWQRLVALTSSLSHSLCELLRMILEPTLASRLRGDYRTGRRLNMRRLIGYIASDFRKDRIWLRRLQPSSRTYQVLLAIDDSASMQRGGGGRTALEAMACIAQALSQLEVGELAVVRFGSALELLHPFDRQWTDDSGRTVSGQFAFTQSRTRWPTVLESLLRLMDSARRNAGAVSQAADCLQLCFLISDGNIQQDREELRRWTREAARRHLLLVLIVVDTDERSITTTQRYVGGDGAAGGRRMFVRYLDDFPFPYYLVLRQIEQLPQVLADALRQWFEAIAATSTEA